MKYLLLITFCLTLAACELSSPTPSVSMQSPTATTVIRPTPSVNIQSPAPLPMTIATDIRPTPDSLIPTVSFCELITNPLQYDQTMIRVRAILSIGYQWFTLSSQECANNHDTIGVAYFEGNTTCFPPFPATEAEQQDLYKVKWNVTVIGVFNGKRGHYGIMEEYPFEIENKCFEVIEKL